MLTSIRVESLRDSSLFVDIPLREGFHSVWANSLNMNARRNRGFFLREADGLGPVKTDVSYETYAVLDGGVQTGSALQIRNLVLTVGLEPFFEDGQTYETLKRLLYLAAAPQNKVRVGIYEDEQRTKYIDGEVESLEPTLFTSDPSYQISIICVEPDFLDTYQNVFETSGPQIFEIDYPGDRPAGFYIDTTFSSPRAELSFHNEVSGESLLVQDAFAANQRLVMTSYPNAKRLEVRNQNNQILRRVFRAIQDNPVWPTLRYGSNRFSLRSNGSASPHSSIVQWRARYGGI